MSGRGLSQSPKPPRVGSSSALRKTLPDWLRLREVGFGRPLVAIGSLARTLPNQPDRLSPLPTTPPFARQQPRRRKTAPSRYPDNRQRTPSPVALATVPGLPSAFSWAPLVTQTTSTRSG